MITILLKKIYFYSFFNLKIKAAKPELSSLFHLHTPQSHPLSPHELLGCTAPALPSTTDVLVYVADGRFHLEAAMIANPSIPAYRYDPYEKVLTREYYDVDAMSSIRKNAVLTAARQCQNNSLTLQSSSSSSSSSPPSSASSISISESVQATSKSFKSSKWGIILGTLGRQGNHGVLNYLLSLLPENTPVILLSEIFPSKLALFSDIKAWVQIACPRLSIDWGYAFDKPLLSPYEASVALGHVQAWWDNDCEKEGKKEEKVKQGREIKDKIKYPMDFYARDSEGGWAAGFHNGRDRKKKN